MIDPYEEKYVQSLISCTMDSAIKDFESDRQIFLNKKKYLEYLKASIYWNRLHLLLSNFKEVDADVERIKNLPWFENLPPFWKAKFLLIEAKWCYSVGKYNLAKEKAEASLFDVTNDNIPVTSLVKKDTDYFFSRVFLVLAKINWRNRDVSQAKIYMGLSLEYYNQSPYKIKDHFLPARFQSHYGQIFLQERNIEKARLHFNLSDDLYKNSNYDSRFYFPETQSLLARCDVIEKSYENAHKLLKLGLKFIQDLFVKTDIRFKASLHYRLAEVFMERGELEKKATRFYVLDQALNEIQEDIDIREKLFSGSTHHTLARGYNLKSRVLAMLGKYDMALQSADEALKKNNFPPHSTLPKNLEDTLKEVGSSHECLKSFKYKAESYLLKHLHSKVENNYHNLEQAWQYFQYCHITINKIRDGYISQSSKISSGFIAREVYELGLEVLVERFKRGGSKVYEMEEELFDIFSSSKSVVFFESLHPSTRGSQTPNNNSETFNKLLLTIDNCFSSNFESHNVSSEETFMALKSHSPQKKSTRNEEPNKQLTLKDLRAKIEVVNGQPGAILSYFLGTKGLYAIIIKGDDPLVFKRLVSTKKEIFTLKKKIKDLSELFDNFPVDEIKDELSFSALEPGVDPTDAHNWKLLEFSRYLYSKLIAPIGLNNAIKRIYIIPDGDLFSVPFCFLSDRERGKTQTKFSKLPYLTLDHKISYHLSAHLLYENHTSEKWENKIPYCFTIAGKVLTNGILEEEFNAVNLHTVKDVAEILGFDSNAEIQKGIDGESLKKDLEKRSSDIYVLHFFGHSFNDRENLQLLLEEDKVLGTQVLISQEEIRNLRLENSHLILVNTCRGGKGPSINGEAPLSLFRAFLKAKAKNIFYSLFRIEQTHAQTFTLQLVALLRGKQTFIDALSNTKKILIKNPETAHPSIWASASFIGNQMDHLHFDDTSTQDIQANNPNLEQ